MAYIALVVVSVLAYLSAPALSVEMASPMPPMMPSGMPPMANMPKCPSGEAYNMKKWKCAPCPHNTKYDKSAKKCMCKEEMMGWNPMDFSCVRCVGGTVSMKGMGMGMCGCDNYQIEYFNLKKNRCIFCPTGMIVQGSAPWTGCHCTMPGQMFDMITETCMMPAPPMMMPTMAMAKK